MKITQRGKVFETNSSSSHSITVDSSSGIYDTISCPSGIITVRARSLDGVYEDVYSRLAYATTAVLEFLKDGQMGSCCSKGIPTRKDIKEMFEKVVKDHTGAKEIEWVNIDEDDGFIEVGYGIDCLYGDGDPADIFKSEQILKDFIFGRDSNFSIESAY